MPEKLKKALTHPVTLVSSVIGTLSGVVLGDPTMLLAVGAAVWAKVGTVFTASSIFAFTLAPNVPELAAVKGPAIGIALVAGALYVTKLGYQLYDSFEDRL